MGHPYRLPRSRTVRRPIKDARGAYAIKRRKRFWEVLDSAGQLVCLTVYKPGAEEVIRRLGS